MRSVTVLTIKSPLRKIPWSHLFLRSVKSPNPSEDHAHTNDIVKHIVSVKVATREFVPCLFGQTSRQSNSNADEGITLPVIVPVLIEDVVGKSRDKGRASDVFESTARIFGMGLGESQAEEQGQQEFHGEKIK